jgi:hydroxyacylglutathione hydrolase
MHEITHIRLTFVNAYLIKTGEGFILVDTGLGFHLERLENELASSGCLPGSLKLVIVTHGDFDHAGNCAKLREKYNCKIAMHKDDLPMVESGQRVKRNNSSFKSGIHFLLRKLFRKKFTFDRFSPDILLDEGQRLDEYGLKASVIHIPGHTKGSIGILTDGGDLFAGDTFTNRGKPEPASLIENKVELDRSLARLKRMDINRIYPGHGDPFEFEEIKGKL